MMIPKHILSPVGGDSIDKYHFRSVLVVLVPAAAANGCHQKAQTQNVPRLSSEGPSTVAKRLARHFALGRSRVLTPVPPDL
jgi:hypothetical protein